MKLPEAGWILIRPQKDSISFTPYRRYQHQSQPHSFRAELGTSLVTQVHTTKPMNKVSPFHLPIRIHQTRSKQIRIGPFIGILTSDGHRLFRGNHKNFADIIRTGRKMGVSVFVLTPSSFGKDEHVVQGFLLDPHSKKNRWLKANLPFPHVIYNRIPDRMAENQKEEQNVLTKLKESSHVQLFNPEFFNKWNLYRMLQANEEWRFIVPTTKPFNQIHTLKTMTKQYPILYAKPIHEKAGIGLMKISTLQHDQFELIYQDHLGRKKYKLNHLEHLWNAIEQKRKNRDYVLQQGIPLIRYHHRPCDFRILIQKDHQGIWQVTGVGVRVAGKNAISTHVPMGGAIANIRQVLKTVFPENNDYIYQRLTRNAIGIARSIEKNYRTPLGEMSMDFGVEQNGRMWFFEANSKPMKFDEPAIRSLSLQRIIDYSLFLSGFSKTAGGKQQ